MILLGRLAVDTRFQGQGIGKTLLTDALSRACQISADLGVHAVEVLAIDTEAAKFYGKYGFLELDSPLHLVLPISSIQEVT